MLYNDRLKTIDNSQLLNADKRQQIAKTIISICLLCTSLSEKRAISTLILIEIFSCKETRIQTYLDLGRWHKPTCRQATFCFHSSLFPRDCLHPVPFLPPCVDQASESCHLHTGLDHTHPHSLQRETTKKHE